MNKIDCPYCKRKSPEDTDKCECGYMFAGYEENQQDIQEHRLSLKRKYFRKDMNYVVLEDIQMSFGSMVEFMVKWSLASIPAMIILMIIGFIVGGILVAIFGAFSVSLPW